MRIGDEQETGFPIPLGCIIARRELGREVVQTTEALIRKSLEYAFSRSDETKPYITRHAQELEDRVIDQHIGLYVNEYSLDIRDEGLHAVKELFRRAAEQGVISESSRPLFLDA